MLKNIIIKFVEKFALCLFMMEGEPMKTIDETTPNIELANSIFDTLKKTPENWSNTLGTAAYLTAMIYSSGSEDKPKKIELLVAFPNSEVAHKRNKGYKITVEQIEEVIS